MIESTKEKKCVPTLFSPDVEIPFLLDGLWIPTRSLTIMTAQPRPGRDDFGYKRLDISLDAERSWLR